MMRIIKATVSYSKDISRLILSDLKNPDPHFPQEMINKFREHAKEERIIKEFGNPKLMAFLLVEGDEVEGFIVGYEIGIPRAMIHYVSAKSSEMKKKLLDRFIKECKVRRINIIIVDTFEFMANNNFFRSAGFTLIKKENITKNLKMLWYELNLSLFFPSKKSV